LVRRHLLALLLLACVWLTCSRALAGPASAATERARAAHVAELLREAKAKGLHEHRAWLRLGHYRYSVLDGYTSEADGPTFFLAEEGKDDPQAELEATLRGFFGPQPADKALDHPVCRFPARFLWLDEQLGIDRKLLPVRRCPRLDEFMKLLRPTGISLIFSSYYLSSPASAFGHTFLRVHRAGKEHEETPDLLDYGVDYSATVDTGNALFYAVKGLLGLFRGDFHKVPYHYKVREYNDYESRDLWEYELELSPRELKMFTAHLWELGWTYFAYYYLSENCSYHILALVEVAKPESDLLQYVGWPVIPADTIKALYETPGMVRSVHYRPSNRTQFRQRMELLSADEVEAVSRLMNEPDAPLPSALSQGQRVKVLDTALDLIDIKMARDLPRARDQIDSEGAETQQRLLERRAEIEVESSLPVFAPPFRRAPHAGHDTARIGLGSGYEQRRGWYHTLNYRLALHDMADPAPGFPDSAEIEFLPMTLRYYVESPTVTLEQISAVRVKSLVPLDRFDSALSFKVDVGMQRTYDSGCLDCPTGFAEVGGGVALAPFGSALLFYATSDARVYLPIEHSGLLGFLRAGLGPSAGLRLRVSDDLALVTSGDFTFLPGQEPWYVWSADGKLRWQYSRNFALGAEGRLYPDSYSAQGMSYIYF
jgi:hypothetical protein